MIIVALFLVAALFPPADRVSPATQGMQMGEGVRTPDTPERRYGQGFSFISEIGGDTQIRFAQWMTEFAVIAVCALLWKSAAPKKSAPRLVA